jgi:excisionase family DNA binding protein
VATDCNCINVVYCIDTHYVCILDPWGNLVFRGPRDDESSWGMSAVPESELFLSLIAERIADEVADRVATKLQKPQTVERVLFNVSEAAVYLGRSKSAVQNMIFDRELPVVRNGRRVHLLRRDLDAWIEKHRT